MIDKVSSTPNLVNGIYTRSEDNISKFKKLINNKPLSISEKILIGHMIDIEKLNMLQPGKSYVFLKPDRVALQDVTGQMVLLQFMQSGLKQTLLPTTVHCDHLIQAIKESKHDTKIALFENDEVYKFLESAAKKYGIGFWKPGAGIIHQVLLENYAIPGGLMIGTDSHTPNAGGLGMVAIGVGGLDAAETMAGMPWELLYPKRIGVYLTGKLNGWTAPKDIILYVASKLTVSGGTNSILEYFGPGAESISCTGKATITNMGAEIGATSSIFPYDKKMETYLRNTSRNGIADLANQYAHLLRLDPEIEENPHRYFDQIIELDLSILEPHIVGPHTPDLARKISKMSVDVKNNKYVDTISVALVGSCTNSSYEDMSRVSDIAKQAKQKGIKLQSPLLITPGSEMIRATIERDGLIDVLKDLGATVLANACGPCIGQWKRPELKQDQLNTIVTSYNRNFPGRNDGRQETMNFIASPEIVIALALAGRLSFNPLTDTLISSDGKQFVLDPPKIAPEVPENGFVNTSEIYIPPADDPDTIDIILNTNSSRLHKLEPFEMWDKKDFIKLPVLAKVKGKCTTDHISPAGQWLMYRGHLDKISDNLLLGAVNAFTNEIGSGKNSIDANTYTYPYIARLYKKNNIRWIIIGDNNYGEGSSREHAAMTPRFLGCAAVIAKTFARIHETNLKKQGILAATFSNPQDYDKILEDDSLSIVNLLIDFKPGNPLKCIIHHSDGTEETIFLNHSYNQSQIQWFIAGSALNLLKSYSI